MKVSTKAFVLAFVAAAMMGMPCMAQDVEPPFTWEGKGNASFISEGGIEEIDFQFEMSIDEQGMVDGKTSNEDGISKIRHVFYTEKKQYDFPGFFTRNIVIVLMFNEYGDIPILTVLNGRILGDRFLYGEMMLTMYEEGSDTAKALGIGNPEATLMEGDDLPNSLRAALKKCFPIGIVKIEGDYKTEKASAAAGGESEDGDTIALFNGKDLEGWHMYLKEADVAPKTVWKVQDGAIWCTGVPVSFLRTKQEYSDYKLVLEWRWPEKPGNSGVLLHMSGEEKIWPLCMEAQLMHKRAGDLVGMGCDFNENKAKKGGPISYTPRMNDSNEKKPGGWNTYEITCKGDTIELTINGQLQNKATGVSIRKGYIGLQSEGVPIMFRNIKLTPLKPSRAAESQPPNIDIWTAAAEGNLEAIKQHVAAGTDLNAREPTGGSTPLMGAALYGQTEAARLLIEKGADVNVKNNNGSSALLIAAFFGHPETVKLLLQNGAAVNAKNNAGQTPLDTVAGEWGPELEELYKFFAEILEIQLDLERIEAARPKIAALLRKSGGKTSGQSTANAATTFRGSYYVNGEIHVNTYGAPEGKPLTTGHSDFKPSWSKTGNMLVFFRRLKNDPVVTKWKTAICVINVDGTGFHKLTDGTHTDFNQTWTRDGSNTPIWNRKNPETGSFYVMQSKVGNSPGQEVALTDKRFHTWAYTCLKDGRILVQSAHPTQGYGYFLMTPNAGGNPRFERIDCELARKGLLDRVSVSPSEKRVCFEYQTGFDYKDTGRTLYIADFDAKNRTITNAKAFANEEGANRWFAYPRWTRDETAIVYHASPSLYLYTLKDGSTTKVSTNDDADYRYPHCEATPK